jgi:hypothetical protein
MWVMLFTHVESVKKGELQMNSHDLLMLGILLLPGLALSFAIMATFAAGG